jgi:hypothetical protein
MHSYINIWFMHAWQHTLVSVDWVCRSPSTYEFSTGTLFFGCQDAIQRTAC